MAFEISLAPFAAFLGGAPMLHRHARYPLRASFTDPPERRAGQAGHRHHPPDGFSLMGWAGTLFVGAVVGLAGWRLHPARRRLRWWLMLLAGAAVALLAKYAGDMVGLFDDGDSLEWLASVLAAIVVVIVLGIADRP